MYTVFHSDSSPDLLPDMISSSLVSSAEAWMKNKAYSESGNWWNPLHFQMNLNHAVRLFSRLCHLELYQEYGLTHPNET